MLITALKHGLLAEGLLSLFLCDLFKFYIRKEVSVEYEIFFGEYSFTIVRNLCLITWAVNASLIEVCLRYNVYNKILICLLQLKMAH